MYIYIYKYIYGPAPSSHDCCIGFSVVIIFII